MNRVLVQFKILTELFKLGWWLYCLMAGSCLSPGTVLSANTHCMGIHRITSSRALPCIQECHVKKGVGMAYICIYIHTLHTLTCFDSGFPTPTLCSLYIHHHSCIFLQVWQYFNCEYVYTYYSDQNYNCRAHF